MDATGKVTKPLDLRKQLEDAYRRAVEYEVEAINAVEPFVARSVSPGEENPVINSDGKWARAIEATERAAELRRALEKFRTEQGSL
jgi:hypothetical protein